jgi:hypothetical protein
MKKIILILFVLGMFSKWSSAQCEKKIVWTSVKEEFTDGNGNVQHTDADSVIVQTTKTDVYFNHNNEDEMKGDIKEMSCNWSEPFKNAKTIIKSQLTEGHGDTHDAVITIEGKDGQITITLELNDKPDMKIKIYANKYEEKS